MLLLLLLLLVLLLPLLLLLLLRCRRDVLLRVMVVSRVVRCTRGLLLNPGQQRRVRSHGAAAWLSDAPRPHVHRPQKGALSLRGQ
jgi:hypothetical protein